jgi:hypothetical protein
LEIRESTNKEMQLFKDVGETWKSMISTMRTVPVFSPSHVICIDEKQYGQYLDQQPTNYAGQKITLDIRQLDIDAILKIIVTALNLVKLFPLYDFPYYITEEGPNNWAHPTFFRNIRIKWETWQRYAIPRGHDFTGDGKITCDEVVKAVNVLEKYYRYTGWSANRVSVALHNFWNALFIEDSTLSFIALVSILETFSNLGKGENVEEQIFRNVPKLVPHDAHARPVTKARLEAIYDARSTIVHGSFGVEGHGNLTWHVTHLDAKFANVDGRLSSELMSIAVKLLRRVIFDPALMSVIENATSRTRERRAIRAYVNGLPAAGSGGVALPLTQ